MSDNVIDLMVSKIQKLSGDSQKALQMAACIGSPFDLKTLSTVLEQSDKRPRAPDCHRRGGF